MSILLLDTHTFIWYSESSPKLPDPVRVRIEDAEQVYVSIVSLWEIAIKVSVGKLALQANYTTLESGFCSKLASRPLAVRMLATMSSPFPRCNS